jgi:hypothetical protein
MTQEEKQLLIQDLSTRLPYKTYVKTTKGIGYVYAINTSQLIELSVANNSEYWSEVFNIDEIKPYLRPMSSMTEEEKKEFIDATDGELRYSEVFDVIKPLCASEDFCASFDSYLKAVDWLNARHFDYRGLIERGLAIEVTKENNPYK